MIEQLLESAITSDDPIQKSLPVFKKITANLPFRDRHQHIRSANLIKYLLMLYPLNKSTIDLIIQEMLEIFHSDTQWINECFKALEDLAMISKKEWSPINESKHYSLELLEQLFEHANNLRIPLDDKCYAFIIYLKHAEQEALVLSILGKIQSIKDQFQYKLSSLHQFQDLVEHTVMTMYQEEQNKRADEQHHRTAAMSLSVLQQKQDTPKEELSPEEVIIELNVDQMLTQDTPVLEAEKAEYFSDFDNLQELLSYITDPLQTEPSLLYDHDIHANREITLDPINYKRFNHGISLDRLYTIRSFKTLKFLTYYKNHQLLSEANEHYMQIVLRAIGGFFQNPFSYGNMLHIISLMQFSLKQELQFTTHYVLQNLLYQMMEYLCNLLCILDNPHVLDFLLRLFDPTYHIQHDMKALTWAFVKESQFITWCVSRIANSDYTIARSREPGISRDGYTLLKKILDLKLFDEEIQHQVHTYNLPLNQLDTLIGPLISGKTIQQQQQFKKMLSKQKNTVIRRNTDLSALNGKPFILRHENLNSKEFTKGHQDIDNLQADVINYNYDKLPVQRSDSNCTTPQMLSPIPQRELQSPGDRLSHKRRVSQNLAQQVHDVKKIKKYEYQDGIKLPQIMNRQSVTRKKLQIPELKISKRGSIESQKNLVISEDNTVLEELSNTFRLLQPLMSPPAASKLHTYYPNSDNNVVDVLLAEQTYEYNKSNNEEVAYYHAHFIRLLLDQCPNGHILYELLADHVDKLLTNYNLRIVDQYKNYDSSSHECGLILIKLIPTLKYDRLFYYQLPKLCRNSVALYKCQSERLMRIQSIDVLNPLSLSKLNLTRLIKLIVSFKDQRMLFKLNDTAMHILTLQFFTHMNSNLYQLEFWKIIQIIMSSALDKQILSLLLKINLIESLSAGYSNVVINQVIVTQWNIDSFLLAIAIIARTIIQLLQKRSDLSVLQDCVKRCEAYQRLKELLRLYERRMPKILMINIS